MEKKFYLFNKNVDCGKQGVYRAAKRYAKPLECERWIAKQDGESR